MKDLKIYDAEGILLQSGDLVFDGYDTNELKLYDDDWYITGKRDMWNIDQFNWNFYEDGIKLVDFRKAGN